MPSTTVSSIPRRNRSTTTTTLRPTRPPSMGSCIIPELKNSKIVNSIFGDEYFPGDHVEDGESVQISCMPQFSLLIVKSTDDEISCKSGIWNNVFPKCQSKIYFIVDIHILY